MVKLVFCAEMTVRSSNKTSNTIVVFIVTVFLSSLLVGQSILAKSPGDAPRLS